MTQIIRIPCGIVNCYLVRQGGAALLVDTAYRGDELCIERNLAAAGVAPGSLRLVFLTHAHIDHAGSAHYFRKRYRLPLAMNALEDDIYRPFTGHTPANRAIWTLTRHTAQKRGPVAPDLALHDGQSLRTYGFAAEAVALPGHTAGSMGLLLPGGRLVCGDLFSYLASPRPACVAEDSGALRESVRHLQERGVRAVYPGHGKPFALRSIG